MDTEQKLEAISSKLRLISLQIESNCTHISNSIRRVHKLEHQSRRINKKRNELLDQAETGQRKLLASLREKRDQAPSPLPNLLEHLLFYLAKRPGTVSSLLSRFKPEIIFFKNDFTFTKKCFYYHLFQPIERFDLGEQSEHVYYLTFTTFLVIDKFRKELSVTNRCFVPLRTLKVDGNFSASVLSVVQHGETQTHKDADNSGGKIMVLCSNYERMTLVYFVLDYDLAVLRWRKFRVTYDLTYNYVEHDNNQSVIYIGPYTRTAVFLDWGLNEVRRLHNLPCRKKGRVLNFVCGKTIVMHNLNTSRVEVCGALDEQPTGAVSSCDSSGERFLIVLFDFATSSVFLVKRRGVTTPVAHLECYDMSCKLKFTRHMDIFDQFLSYHMIANKVYLYDLNNQLVIF